MLNKDQATYKRAVNAALAGGGIQLVIALELLLAALMSGNPAVQIAAWHAFGGLAIWVCIAVVFKQHALERVESLEAEQIAQRHGTDSSIFETTADDLAVQRRRLQRLYRWVVPGVGLLTAAYLIGIGIWQTTIHSRQFGGAGVLSEDVSPVALGFIHAFGVAFIAFVVSRYVAGMGRLKEWQMLRGGAAYLMGSSLLSLLVAIAFGILAWGDSNTPLQYMAVIAPVLMTLVGIEIALNFVFDFYRPRRPGELPRPAFDSRLLSLLTAPESIAKTINEAINYQFGFEITRSWFWQLLSRWIGALVALAIIMLLLLSCLVIVEPHQRALVTYFGQVIHTPENPPYGPGIHLKAPWPIGRAQLFDVTAVRTLKIGSDIDLKETGTILWDNDHVENPMTIEMLIVAPSSFGDADVRNAPATPDDPADTAVVASRAPAVSLVNAEIILHYHIDPDRLLDYVQANSDADSASSTNRDRRLRNIAIQQASRYLLQRDIDSWIGEARVAAGRDIQQLVQAAADHERLGIDVAGISVASVHPPKEVATQFHSAIGAEQERAKTIQDALTYQVSQLTEVAGSVAQARAIVEQINHLDTLQTAGDDGDDVAEQQRELERLILRAGGNAAEYLAWARGDRWVTENLEQGRATRFQAQAASYQAAPGLFRQRELLNAIEGIHGSLKYIIGAEPASVILRGDFQQLNASGLTGMIEAADQRGP